MAMLKKSSILYIGFMASILLTSGCSTHPSTGNSTWALGQPQCRNIGCGHNLNFYPNEENGAQNQARRWYGFEWGVDNRKGTNTPYYWNLPK